MTRIRNHWGLGAVVLVIVVVYSLLPLGTAVQFGGDEGYQLMTSFLMHKGYALYTQIWDDQPPLLVLLLKWVFVYSGPSLVAARLLAAGFGILLFAAFYAVVRSRASLWTALVATGFLLASPGILELSVSVMQEVPAFALALVSIFFLRLSLKSGGRVALIASGVAMGLALAIKFTAGIILPAMVVEIFFALRPKGRVGSSRDIAKILLVWAGAGVATFGFIMLCWGRGSWGQAYQSHFEEHPVTGMGGPQDYPVPISMFLGHIECFVLAGVGILLLLRQRKIRDYTLPAIWLITVAVVHAFHRPWWNYYYLHFAIPLSWIAGFGATELGKPFYRQFAVGSLALSRRETWQALALCGLSAVALVRSEQRAEAGVVGLRARTRLSADALLAKIEQYAPNVHWMYASATQEIYAFHARLPVPPRLAMTTLKRFWSGQITPEDVIAICNEYGPELVLLQPQSLDSWTSFLKNYSVVYQDKKNRLYSRAAGAEVERFPSSLPSFPNLGVFNNR